MATIENGKKLFNSIFRIMALYLIRSEKTLFAQH